MPETTPQYKIKPAGAGDTNLCKDMQCYMCGTPVCGPGTINSQENLTKVLADIKPVTSQFAPTFCFECGFIMILHVLPDYSSHLHPMTPRLEMLFAMDNPKMWGLTLHCSNMAAIMYEAKKAARN